MAQVELPQGVNRVVEEVMLQTVDQQLRLHMLSLAVGPLADSTKVMDWSGEPNYSIGAMGANDVKDD